MSFIVSLPHLNSWPNQMRHKLMTAMRCSHWLTFDYFFVIIRICAYLADLWCIYMFINRGILIPVSGNPKVKGLKQREEFLKACLIQFIPSCLLPSDMNKQMSAPIWRSQWAKLSWQVYSQAALRSAKHHQHVCPSSRLATQYDQQP